MSNRPNHSAGNRARALKKNNQSFTFAKLSKLYLAITVALPALAMSAEPVTPPTQDPELEQFNTTFMKGAQSSVDVQLLLSANSVLPGSYRVDLYSNQVLVGRRDVDFMRNPQTGVVEPCLTLDMLQQLGVDLGKLTAQGRLSPDAEQTCYDLPTLIDQATLRYDSTRLRLAASIPQVAMVRSMRGYVDPALWDEGVPAAFINYQFNTNRSKDDYGRLTSNNLGLRNGINLGGWRLRNESNYRTGTNRPSEFSSNRTYLQHDVTPLKGQFTVGEIYSDAQLFDSVRYRGIKLASDEGMKADGERGYAPVIRGVAETNATVEIRQNDYVLHTTNVPPGPFEISDVYPTGSNGDLEITIVEADGRRRVSKQAFSSLPTMVREGQLQYSVSAGEFNSNSDGLETPKFVSGTTAYGLTSNLTGIAGAQASEHFNAVSVGAGRNTAIGAMSVDITHSSSRAQGLSSQGNSLRALYAKTFTGTDTSFTLAAYRYSTEGYRTFSEHVQELSEGVQSQSGRSKIRTDLTVNQTLGGQKYGNLYLNASDEHYWNRGGSRSLSAGYGHSWRDVSYNLSVTKTKDIGGTGSSNDDTQISLSVSLPLGDRPRAPRAFITTNHRENDDNTQVGVNGYLSDDGGTSYSVQGSNSSSGGNSGSANLSSRLSMAEVSLGYSKGRGYSAENLNISGSVVAHAGGINLGQPLGETFTLVEVPDIAGVDVSNYSGVKTGYNGYAVIPNAQPYRVNWVTLDTRNLGGDIEIENATQQVVPRRGAIALTRFPGKKGRRVQFELFDREGKPIPFGASLEDADGKQLAISDPGGKALALVDEEQGTLIIKWGTEQCSSSYSLPAKDDASNYDRFRLSCTP